MYYSKRGSTYQNNMELNAQILERPSNKELKRPRQCLYRIVSHQKFMMVLLAIAILDALLVATELTADILGTVTQGEKVCNAADTLEYLSTAHRGHLDLYFHNHSTEEIFDELLHRQENAQRVKRDLISGIRIQRPVTTDRIVSSSTDDLSRIEHTIEHSDLPESPISSIKLRDVAIAVRYASFITIVLMLFVKVIRVCVMKGKFFRSKLQVMDALLIIVSVMGGIAFLPPLWTYTDAVMTAAPVIFGVTTRVVRVVINCLINLHEQDKAELAIEKAKLKQSHRRYRQRKSHIYRLRDLARNLGSDEGEIIAASKIVKPRKRKESRKASLVNALMSLSGILFFGAPHAHINPNFLADERYEDIEEKKEDEEDEIAAIKKKQAELQTSPLQKRTRTRKDSMISSAGSTDSCIDEDYEDDTSYDQVGMETDTDDEDFDSGAPSSEHKSVESIITHM